MCRWRPPFLEDDFTTAVYNGGASGGGDEGGAEGVAMGTEE